MKNRFQKENANFYIISGDNYRDRAIDNRPNFSETENFFNYNGNVQKNLSTLGDLMDNYNKNDSGFRNRIVNLAKQVSVAPFIERSIRYDVNILNDENIIFTSEKEELSENDMSTDYKFYIHSFPIFDRNFDVTFESPEN